jgi:alkylated DNA repair dioxygenase AlkB
MGWHRDNERELGVNPAIASVSLGATRVFQIREYESKKSKINILLENGSLLIMKGKTQEYWEHALPKSKTVNEGRINLTFRTIYE